MINVRGFDYRQLQHSILQQIPIYKKYMTV